MLRNTTIFLILLLFIPMCLATQEKVIRAEWTKSGNKIELTNPRLVMDNRMVPVKAGIYLIKLKDGSGKTLYQMKTFQPVNISPPPMDYNKEEIDSWFEVYKNNYSAPVFLPYLNGAKKMTLERGTSILAELDLSVLCNKNAYCGKHENHLSCPEDCPLELEDGYCVALEDKVCDPDCMAGIDSDCGKPTAAPEDSFRDLVLTGLIAAIAVVLIAILIAKKFNLMKSKK